MPDLVHRRLRAPQEDGAALIAPPRAQLRRVVERNRTAPKGGALGSAVLPARAELLVRALEYTRQYRDIRLPDAMHHAPFFMAGHQPELFHPGVWFKNFLLSHVAQRQRGIALNLIVDTDMVHRTAISVPTRVAGQAVLESIPFDVGARAVPYEERPILDDRLFSSFEQRVLATMDRVTGDERLLGDEPLLLEDLWSRAAPFADRQGGKSNLGLVLAESRHTLEASLGLQTLELPLSAISDTLHFRRFMLYLLTELPVLWDIYNRSLAEYRQVNGIRSHTHPVPALKADGEWLEAPFLVWSTGDPERRHLFVRRLGDRLLLSDRRDLRLSLQPDSSDECVEQLAEAERQGIKLRPRALITTMYARLVLSDLFIHGIGGAKYDELTDLIIRRFFGIEPPKYVTATATFRLPIDRPQVTADDVRDAARKIRDVRHHPESLLRDPLVTSDTDLRDRLGALAAEKREFLAQHDLRRCKQEVFQRLNRLNRAMHDLLRPVEDHLRAQHENLTRQLKQSQMLGSREFSFVLFPAEKLSARLLDLCKSSP